MTWLRSIVSTSCAAVAERVVRSCSSARVSDDSGRTCGAAPAGGPPAPTPPSAIPRRPRSGGNDGTAAAWPPISARRGPSRRRDAARKQARFRGGDRLDSKVIRKCIDDLTRQHLRRIEVLAAGCAAAGFEQKCLTDHEDRQECHRLRAPRQRGAAAVDAARGQPGAVRDAQPESGAASRARDSRAAPRRGARHRVAASTTTASLRVEASDGLGDASRRSVTGSARGSPAASSRAASRWWCRGSAASRRSCTARRGGRSCRTRS